MMHDASLFLAVEKIIIFGIYSVIAVQFWMSRNQKATGQFAGVTSKQARSAQLTLVAVFFLCSIAGYLGEALGFSPIVLWVFHAALIAAGLKFIFTRQAAVIMAVLNP